MAGPLVRVDTITAAISLDIDRQLRLGKEAKLEFLTPDRTQTNGWKIEYTMLKNFNRVTGAENESGDGSDVVYRAADRSSTGELGPIVRLKNLHIRVLGDVYKVARVPPVPPNAAQVYTLICGERMARANFDTTKK